MVAEELRTAITTIGVHRSTKARLDKHRASGQCYNGFIGQLIELWAKAKKERRGHLTGSAGENQGASI